MNYQQINKGIILFAFAVLVLLFQNCEQSDGSSSQNDSQSSILANGNGDGYGGKASYVNYDLENKCSSDVVMEESVVEIINSKPYLTVENCTPITPKPLPNFEVKEHNQSFGLDSETLYQRIEARDEISEVFCRGNWFDMTEGQQEFADAYIMDDGFSLTAKIRAGVYKDGVLVQSRDIQSVPVTKSFRTDVRGPSTWYEGVDPQNRKAFTLVVRDSDPSIGVLLSRNLDMIDPPKPDGPLSPDFEDINDFMIIENLSCYRHD